MDESSEKLDVILELLSAELEHIPFDKITPEVLVQALRSCMQDLLQDPEVGVEKTGLKPIDLMTIGLILNKSCPENQQGLFSTLQNIYYQSRLFTLKNKVDICNEHECEKCDVSLRKLDEENYKKITEKLKSSLTESERAYWVKAERRYRSAGYGLSQEALLMCNQISREITDLALEDTIPGSAQTRNELTKKMLFLSRKRALAFGFESIIDFNLAEGCSFVNAKQLGNWLVSTGRHLIYKKKEKESEKSTSEQKIDVNLNQIERPVNLEKILSSLFALSASIFGLQFEKSSAPTWAKNITAFDAHKDGVSIGTLYIDIQNASEEDGISGWCGMLPSIKEKRATVLHVKINIKDYETARLVQPSSIYAIFHEFGHAIEHLLQIRPKEKDCREFMSIFFENLLYSENVLKSIFADNNNGQEQLSDLKFVEAMSRQMRTERDERLMDDYFCALSDFQLCRLSSEDFEGEEKFAKHEEGLIELREHSLINLGIQYQYISCQILSKLVSDALLNSEQLLEKMQKMFSPGKHQNGKEVSYVKLIEEIIGKKIDWTKLTKVL